MAIAISCWQNAPQILNLPPETIHLWRFRLDLPTAKIETLRAVLNADEIARAEKLLSTKKQQQFIAARGGLRMQLGRYLAQNPRTLRFDYGEHGKPRLAEGGSLYFNLAHSGNLALLGLTWNGEIGVDVERVEMSLDYLKLAERYFTPDERRILLAAAGARQRRTFFRLWTRKESELKRIGSGFSGSSASSSHCEAWLCKTLPLGNNYLGSLSFSSQNRSIIKFQTTDF